MTLIYENTVITVISEINVTFIHLYIDGKVELKETFKIT